MNPIFAAIKGTAMKDKKKRAAGAPSTGTYPDNFVGGGITFQLGVGSPDVGLVSLSAPNPNLHASVMYRDGVSSAGGGSFLQITNAAGANINAQGSTSFTISDYIATALRGETPLTGAWGTAQPGVIHVPNVVGQGVTVTMLFMIMGIDNNGSGWNTGTATVSSPAALNTASLAVTGTLSDPMNGNPPIQNNYLVVNIDTSGLASPTSIMLEFRVQANGKAAGTQTTIQANPADINAGTALKVGSCYVGIVFQ